MKTLQALYTEIMGSDELKKAYLEAAKAGKLAQFLKAQGCEATKEEIKAFLAEKSGAQLSEEELDSVAGGTCNDETGKEIVISVFSAGFACATLAIVSNGGHNHNGQRNEEEGRICNQGL